MRRVAFPTSERKQILFMSMKKRQTLTKKYRPISLLPICGKGLERLLYSSIFEFFIHNDLIAPYQSGFKTGESCINKNISINHQICK